MPKKCLKKIFLENLKLKKILNIIKSQYDNNIYIYIKLNFRAKFRHIKNK